MLTANELVGAYEDYLTGSSKTAKRTNMLLRSYGEANGLAIIWRYVIEQKLRITPEQAREQITKQIVKEYRLDNLGQPDKLYFLYRPNDYSLFVQNAYPNEICCDEREYAIREYARVLSGKMTRRKRYIQGKVVSHYAWNEPWAEGFFDGDTGEVHASAVLEAIIRAYYAKKPRSWLYRIFSSHKIRDWLEKIHAAEACDSFESPLQFFHYCYGESSITLYMNTILRERLYPEGVKNMSKRPFKYQGVPAVLCLPNNANPPFILIKGNYALGKPPGDGMHMTIYTGCISEAEAEKLATADATNMEMQLNNKISNIHGGVQYSGTEEDIKGCYADLEPNLSEAIESIRG